MKLWSDFDLLKDCSKSIKGLIFVEREYDRNTLLLGLLLLLLLNEEIKTSGIFETISKWTLTLFN